MLGTAMTTSVRSRTIIRCISRGEKRGRQIAAVPRTTGTKFSTVKP